MITMQIFGEEILDDFNKLLHGNPDISFQQREQIINEYTDFAQHIYQKVLLDTYMPEKDTVWFLDEE